MRKKKAREGYQSFSEEEKNKSRKYVCYWYRNLAIEEEASEEEKNKKQQQYTRNRNKHFSKEKKDKKCQYAHEW